MYLPIWCNPVTIVDDIPVATDGRELCLLVRLVQRAGNGSLRPSPLVSMLLPTYLTGYPLTRLTIMTVRIVGPLPTFNHMMGP